MKKIILSTISLLMINAIVAQNITRSLDDFKLLKVKNAVQVILTQGDENKLTIAGIDEEQAGNVISEVKNGELNLYTEGKIKAKETVIHLTYKSLEGITQSGASSIKTSNAIKAEKFSINGSGAIEAEVEVEVKDLALDFSGASDIKLMGATENFEVKLSGASSLEASALIAENVEVDVSGASDVRVYATESVTGKAAGASNINVKGDPPIKAINSSSSSSRSTSFYGNDNLSINVGKNRVDIKDDKVTVIAGKNTANVVDDTAQVQWGRTRIVMIGDSIHIDRHKKKRRNHWAGVDLGINGFLNSGGSFDLSNPSHLAQTNPQKVTQFMELNYRKSWTFSINFFEYFVKIKEHHFGFVTGLGTEWNNYELKHNVRLTPKGGANVFTNVDAYNERYTWGEIDTVYNYSKNRFKTWFVNVPLLFEVNTGDDANKAFHFSAGAILGMNLQTKMKYKYNDTDGDTKKDKDKDSFNTNTFRASLTARAGYGWFNVFATYSLTPLFESGRGPELYPFTVGITLLGF